MKLISCHIENFGTLCDYTQDFDDGANIILHDNGWGKSTFAAFVRAMFYGLEGERKKSLEENERKRYKPWQGGVFGGRLTFEVDGRRYTVNRIFHGKEADDEFELRDADTNLVSNDYSKNIGAEIFKIDRDSFMRTIFIGQNDCFTSSTDDINAKIGNLTDNTNDINNYETADKKLTDMLNAMSPRRITGSIAKRKEVIADYERRITDGNSVAGSIEAFEDKRRIEEKRYESNKLRLDDLVKKQKKAASYKEILAKKSEWEKLSGRLSAKKKEYDAIKKHFPKEVPDIQAVKDVIDVNIRMERQQEKAVEYNMSDNDKSELDRLSGMFSDNIPSNDIIGEMLTKASEYSALVSESSKEQLTEAEQIRLDFLESAFSKDNTQTMEIIAKWNERNNRKNAATSNKTALLALKTSHETQKANSNGISLLAVIGVCIAVIGLIITFTVNVFAGLGTVVLGIILFVAGLMSSKGKVEDIGLTNEMSALEKSINDDESFVETVDKEVRDYIIRHGRQFQEYSVNMVLQEINNEFIEYNGLKKKAELAKSGSKLQEADMIAKELSDFIGNFCEDSQNGGYTEALHRIKEDASKYAILLDKKEKYTVALSDADRLNNKINEFFDDCGLKRSEELSRQLDDMRSDVEKLSSTASVLKEIDSEIETFKRENDISMFDTVDNTEDALSLEEINAEITALTEESENIHKLIVDYTRSINELQEKYDEWEDDKVNLEHIKEQQEEETKKYKYLTVVKNKLAQAKESLTSRYSAPILNSFGYYYGSVTGEAVDTFHLDANTNITREELGKQREINTLSNGYKDLISVCLRLAFVDAMYSDELPVLIFDDPFTNIDSDKMKAAKSLIDDVACKYQILYFTCSRERAV